MQYPPRSNIAFSINSQYRFPLVNSLECAWAVCALSAPNTDCRCSFVWEEQVWPAVCIRRDCGAHLLLNLNTSFFCTWNVDWPIDWQFGGITVDEIANSLKKIKKFDRNIIIEFYLLHNEMHEKNANVLRTVIVIHNKLKLLLTVSLSMISTNVLQR